MEHLFAECVAGIPLGQSLCPRALRGHFQERRLQRDKANALEKAMDAKMLDSCLRHVLGRVRNPRSFLELLRDHISWNLSGESCRETMLMALWVGAIIEEEKQIFAYSPLKVSTSFSLIYMFNSLLSVP